MAAKRAGSTAGKKNATSRKTAPKSGVSLDKLVTAVPTTMFVVDKDLVVKNISDVTLNALGYRREEVVDTMTCAELCKTPLCNSENCTIKNCMATGKDIVGETEAQTRDGKKIPIAATCSALFDDSGEAIGGMEVIFDLSDQKKALNGVDALIEAAKAGKLDQRANPDEANGDFKKLFGGVNELLDAVIGPLNVAAEYVDRISKGDIPEKITDEYNGDFNEIKNNLNQCIDSVNGLAAEAGMLTEAAVAGKLDTRGDAAKFQGSYAGIVQGVNDTLDAVIGPLNVAAEYVDRISKGDIPEKITDDYNGDFNEIKNNLNQCIDAVDGLVAESKMLTEAAVAGRLDTRGDASKFQGDYAGIVQGVNETLDAVIGPLNVAAEYVDRISKGDIPEKITDDYNGDFNEIKNNLNQCIDSVDALVAEADLLAEAAVAGKLDTRGDATKVQGDYAKIVTGVNNTLDAVIGPLNVAAEYVDRISKGDIPEKITDDYNGDFNEIKNNLNQCIDAVDGLVAESRMLTEAAVAGRLDTRGDASKFQGDYAGIVQGVNETLDAVIGPLNVAAEYVDRISKGDIPEKITDDYNGDFNEIKNNLNQCIDAIDGLTAEAGSLSAAAVEGRLHTRGNAANFQGQFADIVTGVNQTIDSLVGHLDAVPAPAMIIDKEFNVQYLNKTDAKIVGMEQKACTGQKCYSLFKTSDCQTEKCALGQAMAQNREFGSETDAHPAGADLEISYTGLPVKNRQGEIIGGLEIVTDQTAIKQAARVAEKVNEYQGLEVQKLIDTLNKFAAGDLTVQLSAADADGDTAATREKFVQISEAFNTSVDGLRNIITEILQSSESVVSASEQLSATAQEISKGAENQASSLEETSSSITQMSATIQETSKNVENQSSSVTQMAASIEEMSHSINEVARNAGEVNTLSGEASKSAQSGGESVDKTIEGMNKINETVTELSRAIEGLGKRSEEIGNIVNTINDIAEQTNLLALNAAIEAARAGEHGKGFAVVADEVRKLAERSQMSTKDIATLIKGIQDETGTAVKTTEESARSVEDGIKLANEAGVSIKDIIRAVDDTNKLIAEISNATEQQAKGSEQIVSAVTQVTKITEQVSSATEEQSAGSEQIVKAVESVNRITQQNSAAAAEMANSTQQLARLAEDLRGMVGKFRTGDEGAENAAGSGVVTKAA